MNFTSSMEKEGKILLPSLSKGDNNSDAYEMLLNFRLTKKIMDETISIGSNFARGHIILGILALLLNLTILFVLIIKRRFMFKNVFYILIFNFALIDCLKGVCLIAYASRLLKSGKNHQINMSIMKFDQYVTVIFRFCNLATILNLLLITLNEYVFIKHPFWYNRWVKRKLALFFICLNWILCLSFTIGSSTAKAKARPSGFFVSHNYTRSMKVRTSYDEVDDDTNGEGAFGAVYEVIDVERPDKSFALKVESNSNEPGDPPKMLPLEVTVLRALRANNAKYYPGYESCGQTDKFNYVVMGLVGKNINELRKTMPQKRFTIRSCLHIGSRSVLSLSEIHKAGFLHRDLKPANMCIGRAPHDLRSVYILDWGLCRKYMNELGKPHRPRIKAGFRGTPWYASVNALSGQDQGRVDDMWSWFFGLVELTVGKLPWDDGEKAPPEAKKYIAWLAQKKAMAIADADTICAGCPREFQDQYAMLKELDFYAEPLYQKFVDSLSQVMTRKSISDDFPLDWEPNAALARLTTKVPDATMLHRPNDMTSQ